MEPNPAIAELEDLALLELVCSGDDNEAPYKFFVNRFLPEVLAECQRICKNRKLNNHVGQQIAHETFERVNKYKSFKRNGVKIQNSHKAVLVYLFKIAIRLFSDYHRKQKLQEIEHPTYFDHLLSESNAGSQLDVKALANKKDVAVSIFSRLNEKEKLVIQTDLEYKRCHKYLPDDVNERLANELNVAPGSITKIRQRAIVKIKTALDEVNQN